ncbi:dethiobiotin synthase [Bacillus gobiensis]|uniref:dethiobiotin synthase n=1 Tax=Bacillus gobiensis TaxID=1441095 RepID=UPI003D19635D
MAQHFWIAGTDTNVGKTLVTSYFMQYFQSKGFHTIPYKPVQTGVVFQNATEPYSDSEFYKLYSKETLLNEHINSYSFKEPASPHYAAKLEGKEIEEKHILKHIHFLKNAYDYVICEGAGGLYVPLSVQRTYHLLDLIHHTGLPVVLTAGTKVGTINHTLLSINALKANHIPIIGIVFNGYEGSEVEKDNMSTISRITDLPSIVIPKLNNLSDLKYINLENKDFMERIATI